MRQATCLLLPCYIVLALPTCADPDGPPLLSVSLDRHTHTSHLGCAVTRFRATVSGGHTQTPEWVSRDPAVATVDWVGRVRVHGSGRTYIVVTCEGAADSAELIVDITTPCTWRADIGSMSAIALGSDGSVYGATRGRLMALKPTGEIRWERQHEVLSANSTGGPMVAVTPDGSVIVSGKLAAGDGALEAFSPDGDELWRYQGNGLSDPAIDLDGTVYVSSQVGNDSACVVSLGPGSSIERWRQCVALTGSGGPLPDTLEVGAPVIGSTGAVFAGASMGHEDYGGWGTGSRCRTRAFENLLRVFSREGDVLAQVHVVDSWNNPTSTCGRIWEHVAVGPDGGVYAFDRSGRFLTIAHPDGRVDSIGMLLSLSVRPGIRFGPMGVAYILAWGPELGQTTLVAIEPVTGTVRTLTYPVSSTVLPNDLALDGDGIAFLRYAASDPIQHGLLALSPEGSVVADYLLGTANPSPGLGLPPMIGPDGTVYVQIRDEFASLAALPLASSAGLGTATWPLPRGDEANSGRVRTPW